MTTGIERFRREAEERYQRLADVLRDLPAALEARPSDGPPPEPGALP